MSLLDYVYRSGFVSRPSKRVFPTSHPPGERATASVKATLTTIEPTQPALSANGSEQSDQPDEELQQNDNPHQGCISMVSQTDRAIPDRRIAQERTVIPVVCASHN